MSLQKKNVKAASKKVSIKDKKESLKTLPFDDILDVVDTTDELLKETVSESMSDKIQETISKTISSVLGHLGTYTEEPYTIIKSYFEISFFGQLGNWFRRCLVNQFSVVHDMFVFTYKDWGHAPNSDKLLDTPSYARILFKSRFVFFSILLHGNSKLNILVQKSD